jgi:adenylate cyclase
MDPDSVERKLAAILSADVVGYSRLMAEDEVATLRTLTAYLEQIGVLVRQHRGHVVDTEGDNLLAEFPSALDATRCAVEVQGVLRARNASLPAERKMEFRIGLHLSDVMVEGERIYGDGVNIAARLEGLAEPGGICFSGTVHEQVRHKLDLSYEDLGEQRVKNIPDPIRVYRWRPRAVPALDTQRDTVPRTSLLIAPFRNLSPNTDDAFFVRGIVEDLATLLSRFPDLDVIPHHHLREDSEEALDPLKLAHALSVRYFLSGSLRRLDDKIRITVALIDGERGTQLWGNHYDRRSAELFEMQDEIVEGIATAFGSQLWHAAVAPLVQARPENLDAWALVQRAVVTMIRSHTRESLAETEQLLRRAIAIEPRYPLALATLAQVLGNKVRGLFSDAPETDEAEALRLVNEAGREAAGDPRVVYRMGGACLRLGQPARALGILERAIDLDPSWAPARTDLGMALIGLGRVSEGTDVLRGVVAASQLDPQLWNYRLQLGIGLMLAGDVPGAEGQLRRSIDQLSHFHLSWFFLGLILAGQGKREQAREAIATARNLEPSIHRERYEDLIRKSLSDETSNAVVDLFRTLWP